MLRLALTAAALLTAAPAAASDLPLGDRVAVRQCMESTYAVAHLCTVALTRLGDRADADLVAQLQARRDANPAPRPGLGARLADGGFSHSTTVRVGGDRYHVSGWVSADGTRSRVRVR
jgi:hypothetical protein